MSAVHDVVVNAVFDIGSAVVDSKQAMRIGFVLGEEQLRRAFAMQPAVAGLVMIQFDRWVRAQVVPDATPDDGASFPTTRCCGTTPSAAGEDWPLPGPRLATVILIRMSSVSALAYSTKTSK